MIERGNSIARGTTLLNLGKWNGVDCNVERFLTCSRGDGRPVFFGRDVLCGNRQSCGQEGKSRKSRKH